MPWLVFRLDDYCSSRHCSQRGQCPTGVGFLIFVSLLNGKEIFPRSLSSGFPSCLIGHMLILKPITGKGNGLLTNPSLELGVDLFELESHGKRMDKPDKSGELPVRKKETWHLGRLSSGYTALCSGDVFWLDHWSLIIKVIISAPKQWLPHCQILSSGKISRIFWCPT